SVDGGESSDADGSVVGYAWDFGDGGSGSGVTSSWTYAEAGTYSVTLTVTDDDGATHSTSTDVTVVAPPVDPEDPEEPPVNGVVARDAFGRSLATGLGAADVGGAWSLNGAASYFSVADGVGVMNLSRAGLGPSAYLGEVSSDEVDASVEISLDKVANGGGVFASLQGRVVPGAGDYRAKVKVAGNGALTLYISRLANGSEVTLASQVLTGVSYALGDSVVVRMEATGTSPTVLNAKAWKAGSAEPAAWQLSEEDSTASLQVAGGVGIQSYLTGSATNAPVRVQFDELNVTSQGQPPVDPEDPEDPPVANGAPVAAFTSSVEGLVVSVDGGESSDADGSVVGYAWNFGDDITATTPTASHTYAAAGTYSVTLTVTDNDGATHSTTESVTVAAPPVDPEDPEDPPVVNVAPVAAFTSSTDGLALTVDGTGSTDSDGTVASYLWNFGDDITATTPTASHTYAAAGTYPVTLTVTDDDGATHSTTDEVVVEAPPVDPEEPPAAEPLAQDSFARTVANGLGAADVGGNWTLNGAPSYFSVADGTASIRMIRAGAGPFAYLNEVSSSTAETRVNVSLDKVANGGGTFIMVTGRRVGVEGEYRTKVKVAATGAVAIDLTRVVGSTVTTLQSRTINGLSYAVGDELTIKFSVSGTSPTTLGAKVWKAGETEPEAWQVTASDSTAELQVPGGVGLMTYVSGSSTNAPITGRFTNLLVRDTSAE
ncbi:PKD domain-containing protein, partial [Arthrobacter sp. 260]|uniref:PKD domain-containing protein n=1 Tax=Arthrobacter sp. 260 TaxID=2735314 RepID=UPI001490DA23